MAPTLRKGWLNDQYAKAWADVQRWPEWMREAAGLSEPPQTCDQDMAKKNDADQSQNPITEAE